MVEVAAGKIIDAHCHVWTSDTNQYPLASAFGKSDLWLPSFTPEDHFKYSRLVGDVRINLVQMTCASSLASHAITGISYMMPLKQVA